MMFLPRLLRLFRRLPRRLTDETDLDEIVAAAEEAAAEAAPGWRIRKSALPGCQCLVWWVLTRASVALAY